MTRKHYIQAAATLRAAKPSMPESDWRRLCISLAEIFRQANPAFSVTKFLLACEEL